jgi:N-acetylglucosamine kinase-like BadF-type ATPase
MNGNISVMPVLGIDVGGTKTVCQLADNDERVISEAREEGANLQGAGELALEKVLHSVMEKTLDGTGAVPAAICLGIAGVDRATDETVVRSIMSRIGYKARILVVNDALIALQAGIGDAAGIVIVAGTGSIAYGRNGRGEAARAGGWGYVLGDEGSGYWIGRLALRAVVRHADGRGRVTSLTPRLLAHFGVARASDLINKVYHEEVIGERDFTFVLAGGMFHGVPWLGDQMRLLLPTLASQSTVMRLNQEPALGAVRLALAELKGGARLPVYRPNLT